MDAGRDLDALVAEKVMGWTKTVSADHTNSPIQVLREMGIFYQWTDTTGKVVGLDIPPYSTDIAAAWQAVDKLRSLGWYLWLEDAQFKDVQYTASFILAEPMTEEYPWRSPPIKQSLNDASTAPHAICCAALRAVGYEAPQ